MMFQRFLKDRKAGVAPLLALAAIPIIGAVGTSIDYSRASSARTAMQAATDATVLALAGQPGSGGDVAALAHSHFSSLFSRQYVQIATIAATASSAGSQYTVTVSASGSVKTMLLGVLGISVVNIDVKSTAASVSDGLGCILTLNKSASSAFSGQGSSAVALKGCSLYDNSTSSAALSVDGSAKVSALSVGVVGGVAPGSYGLTADYGIRTGIRPVVDPYKDVEPPSFGACTESNFKTNKSVTLDPGVYCGGIDIHSGATVTLNPGIYYLDGGELNVNGGAALIGTGVTLVFTSKNENNWATASINGNATVDLSPPGHGPTAGIVMFGNRNIPNGTVFKLNGGAYQNLAGAIYLPSATINFSGGNATGTSCTQIIGDIIKFTGNSSLALNCSSHPIKPFSVFMLRLIS